ncbi:MAG: hypothetical protein JW894_10655 [Bacteroidales bacterium]|nr:hypothetical protein [Bacteroidales bacterium]
MTIRLKILLLLGAILVTGKAFTQGNIEDLLYTEVDNLNPVYKPVVGFGVGAFNYLGDVRDPGLNILNGTLGYKVNVSTFVDNNHYIRSNFYFMYGALSGNERSYNNLMRNLNFRSEVLMFGVNLNYDFDNLYKKYNRVHPFISIGFEIITFDSKIDSLTTFEGVDIPYNYWDDGSIRNLPQTLTNIEDPRLATLQRDYDYETDLRSHDWGRGDYAQYAFAVPIDVGFDFWLSDRVLFSLGTSYHLTFSDDIDHVNPENENGYPKGNNRSDDFMYTYFSLHLDLFSSKKTLTMQRLFADVELDLTLIGDEDYDGYFDGWDQCPNTPFGVETDTTGCPLDDDFDGIPNYQDDEPYSRYGAYVDERGVEITEDELIAKLDNSLAVAREDVTLYLREPSSYTQYGSRQTYAEIPPKFESVDSDSDGYISFDEILDEIDKFFDFDSNLNSDEIHELNDFFFSQ